MTLSIVAKTFYLIVIWTEDKIGFSLFQVLLELKTWWYSNSRILVQPNYHCADTENVFSNANLSPGPDPINKNWSVNLSNTPKFSTNQNAFLNEYLYG